MSQYVNQPSFEPPPVLNPRLRRILPESNRQISPSSSYSNPEPRPRKDTRPNQSCSLCRARRTRCDRILPCSQCSRRGTFCDYSIASPPQAPSGGRDFLQFFYMQQNLFESTLSTVPSDRGERPAGTEINHQGSLYRCPGGILDVENSRDRANR
ncbi:hypothetical protein PPACK8108_LOCUS24079 [Phakopsora pachyrhizi]|nr:hypothetical protein PPACK8108_LOCUS24079 [Phakopsora pachyrhizi]